MSWNLEGMHIDGSYMYEIPVTGTVRLSRVAYGGDVHHVDLDRPINVHGAIRESVILNQKQVVQVRDRALVKA